MSPVYSSKSASGNIGYRIVAQGTALNPEEVEVEGLEEDQAHVEVAQMVWPNGAPTPRLPTSTEALEKAREEQEGIVRDAANAHYEASTRSFEGAIVAAKYGRGGLPALNAEERIVFDAMNADYTRLKSLVVQIRAAATVEAVRAVVW